MNKLKIINNDWIDNIYLDFKNMSLSREYNKDEKGFFTIKNNILIVKWQKWDEEYYAEYNGLFYNLKHTKFITEDWEDICYIDYHNNIVYRPNDNNKGILNYIRKDTYNIEWEKISNNFLTNILNVENIKNSDKKLSKIEKNDDYKIPNIIHFVYGFKKQDKEFDLYKYLSIKSAIDVNNPDKVYFHYKNEPYGKYWDKIKKYLTLEYVQAPAEIYGNELLHYAHQSDVIRLQKLQKYGGIYLDIDTICLKSFDELRRNEFVLGVQSNQNDTEIYGLCNAVILSMPEHKFIIDWIDSYTTFRSKGRDEYWDEHSVLMPLKLAYNYSGKIKILSSNNFYYPLWYSINSILFDNNVDINEYKKIINNNFCIHLWDTYSNKYLSNLTEKKIFNENNLYNILVRKFLRNKISILFLTHNRLDSLKDCLNSYLKVLDNDNILELIIFDNNSEEETKIFLKEFKTKHLKNKIIFNNENIGVCLGRIELFEKSKGDIICSLDSDAKLLNKDFFDEIIKMLYDEKYGLIGISGSYINSWEFQDQTDIDNKDTNNYYCHHISGCCQIFRRDLFNLGFGLDKKFGFFWCEDTDLSLQLLNLNKLNYRISGSNYIHHEWGGSGKKHHDLFIKNWEYLRNKWENKIKFGNVK